MSKRLMIVDDSIFVYEEMKHILQNSDFEIVAYAKSGEEALAMYEDSAPDIVTLDIIMPGMDGLDTAKHMFSKWPDAKIVMVSSLAYDDTITQAKNLGIRDFIFKPISEENILSVLTTVVNS